MLSYLVIAGLSIGLTLGLGRVDRPWPAVMVCTTLASVFVFQLLAYLSLGYLDAFFPIAVVVTAALSALISAATLVLVSKGIRNRRESNATD